MKAMRKIAALLVATGALAAATPAQAGWAIIYFSDYFQGTQVGAALQDNCGSIVFEWGVRTDIYQYGWVDVPGCGSNPYPWWLP